VTTPAAPRTEIGHVIEGPSWWNGVELETTPELRWPLSVEVYDRMRRQDAQVGSVLRAVTLPVRRTQWRVDPNGSRPEVAKLVSEDLGLPLVGQKVAAPRRARDRFSWMEHLRLALLMLPLGHSVFEQVYRPVGDQLRLRKLSPRPARTIEQFNVASDGGLISIKQWGGPEIPVDRLVAYVHDMEGGSWIGHSILRTCYKNWLLKDRLLRVQVQTVERNGMGVPLYKGAEKEQDLSAGLKMAKAWRSGDASGAAVPNGADLVLRGVDGDLPDAEGPIRYHDEQIARAVLAHFLNLGTQTGSWALGSTFADFFTLSLQSVAQQIADVATQHIVEDLVDVNWGEDEPAPRIVFDEIGSRHAATAEAIKLLVDSGVVIPDEGLEEQLRQAYGLPLAEGQRPDPAPAPAARPVAARRRVRAAQVDTTYADARSLHQRVAEAALREAFERQRADVQASGSLAEAWDEELTELLYTLSRSAAHDVGTRVTEDFGGTVKASVFDLAVMDGWLLTVAAASAEAINAATREALEEEPPEDSDEEDPVEHTFKLLDSVSAAMYARSLVSTAASFAAKEAGTAVGARSKQWKVNSSNPRSSHSKLNGEVVDIEGKFSNGMRWPGDSAGGPGETANCECSMVLMEADSG
jgi:hypothetical protein